MKTREILNTEKIKVIENEVTDLNSYVSYQNGLRDAKKQAAKNYETELRSIKQKRWFKIIKQQDHPTVIWSHNTSLTMVVYEDGQFKYDDEITGSTNFCRVVGASAKAFIPFYGTIGAVIAAVKNDIFSHEKEDLLCPVEFVF